MPEVKFVVAKNLTGKGHEQRQRAFIDHLKNEAEVTELYFVGSGRPPGKQLPKDTPLDREFPGITWKYGNCGIDYLHAATQLLKLPALRQSRFEFADFLRQYRPIGLWADFEFVACGGAQKYKAQKRPGDVPIFTQRVDHHSAFLSRSVPRPDTPLRNVFTDLFLSTFCKADRYHGFHFKRYEAGRPDLVIDTPVIQREIRDRVREGLVYRGRHILGYLPGYDLDVIEQLVMPYTDRPWIVYHQDVKNTETPLPHLTFKPLAFDQEYLNDLSTCFGAVVTTGFQLPAELLYMKKYFVGIIQRGQPEQSYNAAALRDIDVPVFDRLTSGSMERVNFLFKNEHDRLANICETDMEQVYPDNTKEIVQDFVERCLRAQRRKRATGVPQLTAESFEALPEVAIDVVDRSPSWSSSFSA